MKKLALTLLGLVAIAALAFLLLHVPDTDPAEMRAKYGGEPSRFVEMPDGNTFHIRDEGPRGGLPIVLLHGSNADLHTWEPWARTLSGDYRVIRFDQIGHGLTGASVDGEYTPDAFAADVEMIADALGLERFVLAGNSMGGGVAMTYALQHPERLAGLVLVDASGAPVERDSGGNLAFTLARIPGVGAVLSQFLPRSLVERSLSQSVSNQEVVTPEAVDRYWELARYPGTRAATRARFAARREPFAAADVAALQLPVLVMWGKEDALIPYDAAGWFMRHLPDASLAAYDDIGHLPMEEAPDRSASDLRAWLSSSISSPQPPADPAPAVDSAN
ncbi:alpha/beta fold hydrolase [Altererythrobacter sp. MTPC7]|uniref:alpha/beta fold hydrolase n=1 Tax=Altererythrobacter sp. MTPC7 TaxID=3056567 RepID=UPI0036F226FD